MSVVVGDLLVKLALENAQYKAELEASKRASEQSTGVMQKGADLVGKAWRFAAPMVVGALTAIATATVAAVGLGSDLNETTNKVGVVFGEAGAAIVEFSTTTAGALGQSQQQALDAASTFGIFGKSAGLAGEDLSDFAIDLTTLASDFASFHNASPEEAILAIGAALRGESEPIRRFGVLLDEATLKNKALEMGLISTTTNALTPQQRVLAAYNVILEQTVDAQGDFERTSSGLANSQRILKAELTDLATEWGSALLPIVEEFAGEAIPVLIEGLGVLTETRLPRFVELVGQTADGLLTAFEAGMLLVTWSDRIDMALEDQESHLIRTSGGYEEYAAKMNEAGETAGRLVVTQEEYNERLARWGDRATELKDAIVILNQAQFEAMQRAYASEDAELRLATARANSGGATGVATAETVAYSTSLSILEGVIGGVVEGLNFEKQAASLLNEVLVQQGDTLAETNERKIEFLYTTGQITQAEYEDLTAKNLQLRRLEALNGALAGNMITQEQWNAIVADGTVTVLEMGRAMAETWGPTLDASLDAAADDLQAYADVMQGLNDNTDDASEKLAVFTGSVDDTSAPLETLRERTMQSKDEMLLLLDSAGRTAMALEDVAGDYQVNINVAVTGDPVPSVGGGGGGGNTGQGTGQGGTGSFTGLMAGPGGVGAEGGRGGMPVGRGSYEDQLQAVMGSFGLSEEAARAALAKLGIFPGGGVETPAAGGFPGGTKVGGWMPGPGAGEGMPVGGGAGGGGVGFGGFWGEYQQMGGQGEAPVINVYIGGRRIMEEVMVEVVERQRYGELARVGRGVR